MIAEGLEFDSAEIGGGTIHPEWLEQPAALAKRLQAIIIGVDSVPHSYEITGDRLETHEPRWHFDPHNDWWLHLHPERRTFHLCYRYGKMSEQWAALKIVIEMFLG